MAVSFIRQFIGEKKKGKKKEKKKRKRGCYFWNDFCMYVYNRTYMSSAQFEMLGACVVMCVRVSVCKGVCRG